MHPPILRNLIRLLFSKSIARFLSGGFLALMTVLPLRVSAAGAYWQNVDSFKPAIESPDPVDSVGIAAMPGGKVLITSHPGIINGKDVTGKMIRLNADGTIDNTYNGPSAGGVLATYADGRILLLTQPVSGFTASVIQRLLADGSPDVTFAPVAIDYDQFSALILSDGRLLVYGSGIRKVGGVDRRSIAIIGSDGTLDTTFQSPFSVDTNVYSIAQTVDGQHFILSGQGLNLGTGRAYLARLNSNGTVDPTFAATDTTFTWNPSRTYPENDGGVLVTTTVGEIFRVASTGLKDNAFAPVLIGTNCNFGPQQPDGKIYYTSIYQGSPTARQLHRMNHDGSDDGTFPTISTPYSSSYQVGLPVLGDDGTLWLGPLTAERYAARYAVSHVLVNGSIDPSFQPRFARQANIYAYTRQADGKHVIASRFDHVNDVAMPQQFNVARLNNDGSLDSGFTATVPLANQISGLAVQPGGAILLYGNFPNGSGGVDSVLRLTSAGASDATFHAISNLGRIALDNAGYIYGFTNTSQLMRYNPDGTPDASFQAAPFATGTPTLVVPLDNGSVLVALSTGSPNFSILRLLHGGSIDANYAPDGTSGMVALSALPSGKVLKVTWSTGGPGSGYFVYERLLEDGMTDYRYVGRPASTNSPDPLESAGVLFDLLKEAAGGGNASGMIPYSSNAWSDVVVQTDGQLIVHRPSGIPIQRYQRTALTSPSVDASPLLILMSPSSAATLRPLNWSQHFSVVVSGLEPFTYQWLKDGVPIAGKTSQGLTKRLTQDDAGSYSVQITNAYGTITSPTCAVTLDPAHSSAAIVTPPSSQTRGVGVTAVFSVVASGDPTLSYQWYFNGDFIAGATGPTLTLNNVQIANAGAYAVQVSNSVHTAGGNFFGSVISGEAILTVTSLAGDYDGDGVADASWQHPAMGQRGLWLMSGNQFAGGADFGVVDPNARIAAAADFNGDGKADILWQNISTGARYIWLMNGTTHAGDSALGNVLPEWSIAAAADFNADGKPDILWQNTTTGERYVWFMNGTVPTGGVSLGAVALEWSIVAAADFNADGKPDLLWQNTTTGERYLWLMNGAAQIGAVSFGTIPVEWSIVAAADFNADGKPDILWQNTTTSESYVWFMNGTSHTGDVSLGVAPQKWSIAALGDLNGDGSPDILWQNLAITGVASDFNGDGKPDILWQNTTTGDRALWYMNGAAYASAASLPTAPTDWTIVTSADFNADGKPDFLWQNNATGEHAIWYMNGAAFSGSANLQTVAPVWSMVAAADFNADGKPDILWQNTSTGERYLWFMDGATHTGDASLGVVPTQWSIAAVADFNADGKPDILWQNTSTGERVIWFMNGAAQTGSVSLGVVPVEWSVAAAADYNGDVKPDILWQNTTTGERYLWFMNGATHTNDASLGVVSADWKIVK